MNLDDALPYDLDELIDRALRPYRPALSFLVAANLREYITGVVSTAASLAPWVGTLAVAARSAPASVEGLTPAQRALLGGGTPARALDAVVDELEILVDGGSASGAEEARTLFIEPFGVLSDLAALQPMAPEADPDAAARGILAFLEVGVPAMIAALLAAFLDPSAHDGRTPVEMAEVNRYMFWIILAYTRITWAPADKETFDLYYMNLVEPERVAKRLGHPVSVEIERRFAFARTFGAALVREIPQIEREAGPDPARNDMKSSPRLKAFMLRGAAKVRGRGENR